MKIKCIDAAEFKHLTLNKEYEVLEVTRAMFHILNDMNEKAKYNQKYFEAVKEGKMGDQAVAPAPVPEAKKVVIAPPIYTAKYDYSADILTTLTNGKKGETIDAEASYPISSSNIVDIDFCEVYDEISALEQVNVTALTTEIIEAIKEELKDEDVPAFMIINADTRLYPMLEKLSDLSTKEILKEGNIERVFIFYV